MGNLPLRERRGVDSLRAQNLEERIEALLLQAYLQRDGNYHAVPTLLRIAHLGGQQLHIVADEIEVPHYPVHERDDVHSDAVRFGNLVAAAPHGALVALLFRRFSLTRGLS